VHHDIVLRRAQVAVTCECPCQAPDQPTDEGCPGEIPAGGLVIEHIDDHGYVSRRCEVCGAKPDTA
jgi:hypothetical protein